MYDIAVIGGGPGGYTCAIRAAQLGATVCLIEKNGLGGTCTQRGCIPTKYLHSLGDIIRRTDSARKSGINATVQINYSHVKSKMFATVSRLASGIKKLLESNGVELIHGEAHIQSPNKININNHSLVETRNIVIATGSIPVCMPSYQFGEQILSTNSVLELDQLPKSITIIGGGYSGCEFASILNALGCKVCLIEAQDHLLPMQISEVGDMVEKFMVLDGITIMTKSSVEKIIGTTAFVGQQRVESEKILLCTGRRPNVKREELSRLGLIFNPKGINVNEKMQTNIPSIYAVGDVTGMYELAHVSARQGEVAAENIMGVANSGLDYNTVPVCIFTYPEVAIVGDLRTNGRLGECPLAASAKANCLGDTRGTIKVFEKEGKLVGTYIVASHAGEIIGEAALAIKMKLNAKDIYNTILPHPTLPESFQEAVRDIYHESIHLPSKRNTNQAGL
ncbi:MAG TPA: dihydrolipoyl dehydrogenase [Nitrososphaeraceae archaeon]|nr:dihydrolipoyl dehydrogenase [Nitrososphaeraceae archaeon]